MLLWAIQYIMLLRIQGRKEGTAQVVKEAWILARMIGSQNHLLEVSGKANICKKYENTICITSDRNVWFAGRSRITSIAGLGGQSIVKRSKSRKSNKRKKRGRNKKRRKVQFSNIVETICAIESSETDDTSSDDENIASDEDNGGPACPRVDAIDIVVPTVLSFRNNANCSAPGNPGGSM